ncbi:MAG: acetate--CoA ligase family protein [Bacteroidetes bacterium]|nr:acetate--CoA ligase family protein [Bacteroidota bacterium]
MVNHSVINPSSIAVIGASNNLSKPGGKILRNILAGGYTKPVYAINPHEKNVQGVPTFANLDTLTEIDLGILLVPPKACLEYATILLAEKKTKALIIISAGFGELNEAGKQLETEIINLVNNYNACLIGPNCIGVLNQNYHGMFTTPIPELTPQGCDLISSSGATAVFLMEASIPLGLKFSNVFSVGNAVQTTIADILEYLDETYDPKTSSPIKLLYIENIFNPQKLLRHAASLIRKGCKIAAIKAGTTASGSRAASSHTGAIANPDMAVKALFRKAGIVLCQSRQELIAVASVFHYKELKGQRIAIITHAGGSAVMLTDALSRGGLEVPEIKNPDARELITYLNNGSSVKNPIDFLATGTAEQLGIIIDFCEHKFDEIDAMVVVFGSPGLFDVENVYKVLNVKLDVCKKPIFPVLPSVMNAQKEIAYFLSKGHVNFPDEVVLGNALSLVYHTHKPVVESDLHFKFDETAIQKLICQSASEYLTSADAYSLLSFLQIPCIPHIHISNPEQLAAITIPFPWVVKIVGPLHKTESCGVLLNIHSLQEAQKAFDRLSRIDGFEGVLVQQMRSGSELFVGVKFEPKFGHLLFFGLGGVFIEVLEDYQYFMTPADPEELRYLLRKLKGYKLFEGLRGKPPVNQNTFIEIILKISTLLKLVPGIQELDLNPLIADGDRIEVADVRIRVLKT